MIVLEEKDVFKALIRVFFRAGLNPHHANILTTKILKELGIELSHEQIQSFILESYVENPNAKLKGE